MDLHATAIRALQRSGLYVIARSAYHRLSPSRRRSHDAAYRFYAQFVWRGSLCFDIGANVGQTTEAMLALGARVIAVEPNPLCVPVLDQRFGSNPAFTLEAVAIGATPGRAQLHVEGTASTASLRSDWPFAASQTVDVPVTTLAALIERYGRPDVLKVDVEGFEVDVFNGLDQPVAVVYFEMHAGERDRAESVLTRLAGLGAITGINVTDVDHQAWLLDDWISRDAFAAEPTARFPRTANVVVKMQTAAAKGS